MNQTPYHAKYYADELTRRRPSDSVEKLAGTLVDAQVDLSPHQVDAALFAFRIAEVEGKLQQSVTSSNLFSIRWRLT